MAQDPVNVGTTPNDRTGDPWRDAMIKLNADIAALYANPLTNVNNVNLPSEFPAAVSGVRELVETAGVDVVYDMGALELDMGTDRFTVTDANVVIRGASRTGTDLKSLVVGDFFTVSNGSVIFENFSFDCPNAQVLNFASTAGFRFVSFAGCNINACTRLGTISGSVVTAFGGAAIVNSSVGGFLFTGSTNGQLTVEGTLAVGWTGTLFDLGTATFNLIQMDGLNRFISPSGTTVLSGLANNGNFNSGGRGIVTGAIFNGTGTALSGIDPQDTQWQFRGNLFADGTTINTRNLACVHLFGSPGATVTINTINIFEEVGGTAFISNISDRFTVSTSGVITYIGLGDINVELLGRTTLQKTGGGSNLLFARLAKNWQPTDTSKTGDTNTDINITNMSSIANLKPGVFVSGTDIPADTTIVSVGATDSIVISEAATGSSSGVALTFHDKGVPQSGGETQNATPTSIPLGTLFSASTGDNFRIIYANGTGTSDLELNVAAFEIGGGV